MASWSDIQSRVDGKWQLPLLLMSLGMLGWGVLRIRPTPERLPADVVARELATLVSSGLPGEAIEIGERVLSLAERSDREQAPILMQLARARFADAVTRGRRTADAGRRIASFYRRAASSGEQMIADDFERLGLVFEWQNEPRIAQTYFKKAIEDGHVRASDLRRHVIELSLANDELRPPPAELEERFDVFLAAIEAERLDLRLWAIEHKLELFESMGRIDEGGTLLVRHHDTFVASTLAGRFRYLEALLLHKTGHPDDAEAMLRAIRSGVDPLDDVYAMTGWLLGRVVMNDSGPSRPQEALSFFEDVLAYHPSGPYAIGSWTGKAEALALLERHADALDAYQEAIKQLAGTEDRSVVDRDVLRTSLSVRAEVLRQASDLPSALAYARLASELVDHGNPEQATALLERLALLETALASQMLLDAGKGEGGRAKGEEEAYALFEEAGEVYVMLARLNTLRESAGAKFSWLAAESFSESGDLPRSVRLYRMFVRERPQDPRVPRALFRMGSLQRRLGWLSDAVDSYRECHRRFPRTIDGARVLVPLARCFLNMGDDQIDLAEKALNLVLDDSEVFTPDAPEFAAAMFLSGDVLLRRGRFEASIPTLEEALERYPEHIEADRARFLLADAYRQSALALKREVAEVTSVGEIEQMRRSSQERFGEARGLYREMIVNHEMRGEVNLTPSQHAYLRLAYLYEADCYFETQSYRRALKLYEDAAAAGKDLPAALGAYVQIINCHAFLGERQEARAALARALILVEAIPQEAFDASLSPQTREDWRKYYEWLGEAEIF